MDGYRPEQVVNGSHGEVWINGDYLAEAVGIEAKITLDKAEVNMCKRLSKGYKVTGYEGKGTLKLNKVTSRFIKLMSENMKKGKQTVCTLISNVEDPDALGAERIALNDVTFDELTVIDWEAKKNGEESMPFTFSDWEVLESIDVP